MARRVLYPRGMSSSKARWVLGELPGLVAGGVIDQAAADRLRQHFEAGVSEGGGRRVAVVAFGGLGAALIGGGIVLMLAHNWDELSRSMRAGLTLGLLLAAQGLAGWALHARRRSTAWGESAAAFLALAVGASIALVSQTYHLGGDFRTFLLTWCLLALPLAFLFESHLTAAIVWVLAFLRTWGASWERSDDSWFWALAGAGALYFLLAAKRAERDWRLPMLAGVATAALVVGGTASVATAWRLVPVLLYLGGLLGFLYAAGAPAAVREATGWQRVLRGMSVPAIVVCSLIGTYDFVWNEGVRRPGSIWHTGVWVGVALGALALVRALRDLREARWDQALFAGALVPATLGVAAALAGHVAVAMLVFNAYLAALGLATLVRGLGEARLGATNVGLILLTTLASARFFDADLSFLARGIGFILVGLSFLGVNVYLVRRRGEATP
jgi:uncharacterized membrane protein